MNPTDGHRCASQTSVLSRCEQPARLGQLPRCIWFTGLPAAGKTTLAGAVEQRLHREGRHTYLLDGDDIRHGLCRDLGFSDTDRVENVRRVAEVAKLMVDAGLIVLVALVSPFRSDRQMARGLFSPNEFVEVYVETPLKECERRDPKGLYAMARRGKLMQFTGIDSRYEPPVQPEARVDTSVLSVDRCVEHVLLSLQSVDDRFRSLRA